MACLRAHNNNLYVVTKTICLRSERRKGNDAGRPFPFRRRKQINVFVTDRLFYAAFLERQPLSITRLHEMGFDA